MTEVTGPALMARPHLSDASCLNAQDFYRSAQRSRTVARKLIGGQRLEERPLAKADHVNRIRSIIRQNPVTA
ncbi:MAG TPA: hypothetical protein VEI25_16780 [Paraburkholderia sp.]|nr:hypothetical protein [Paraburkholderia sp.]